jgi:hypothetical protein
MPPQVVERLHVFFGRHFRRQAFIYGPNAGRNTRALKLPAVEDHPLVQDDLVIFYDAVLADAGDEFLP